MDPGEVEDSAKIMSCLIFLLSNRERGAIMIKVTRINGVEEFFVNENKIEFIEETPDTVISLESGKKIVVLESIDTILQSIAVYRAQLYRFRTGERLSDFTTRQ